MSTTLHLTPDQIDDHLLGDLAPAAAAHLTACGPCQVLVAQAEAPMAAFRSVSLAWAERRSATLPVPSAQAPKPAHRFAWAALAGAATAAIALALSVPMLHHAAFITTVAVDSVPAHPTTSAPAQTTTPQPVTVATLEPARTPSDSSISASPDEIARDNAMLAAIDEALNAPSAGFTQTSHHGPMRTNVLQQ